MSNKTDPNVELKDLASPGSTRTKPVVEPELISAEQAALMVGVGKSTWWGYHASGLCPLPVRLGGRTLWRLSELKTWIAADCPPRQKWQGMRKHKQS